MTDWPEEVQQWDDGHYFQTTALEVLQVAMPAIDALKRMVEERDATLSHLLEGVEMTDWPKEVETWARWARLHRTTFQQKHAIELGDAAIEALKTLCEELGKDYESMCKTSEHWHGELVKAEADLMALQEEYRR